MRKPIFLLAAAALALTPAAAQGPRYLNPQDVADAQRQHAAIIQEFGGAETGARAAYVESVGRRVGAYSGVANPGQALRFTTLNAAVPNAMSVPGGYVYVTRQLLTLMDDESQLAFAKRATQWEQDTVVSRKMAFDHYWGPNAKKAI